MTETPGGDYPCASMRPQRRPRPAWQITCCHEYQVTGLRRLSTRAERSFWSWERLQGLTRIGGVRPADVGVDRHDRDGPPPVRPDERPGGSAARGRPRSRGLAPARARRLAPRGVVPF